MGALLSLLGGHLILAAVLMAIVFVGILFVGTGLLPRLLVARLQQAIPAPKPISLGEKIAVVVLGEGTTPNPTTGRREPGWLAYSRIAKAAAIYHEARAKGGECKIFITGERSRYDRERFPLVYPEVLASLGVDSTQVISEDRGINTYQHAEFTAALLRAEGLTNVYLVTSALHLKRAALYFAQFNIDAVPVPSDYIAAALSPLPLGYNFAVAEIAWHQFVGIARLSVYNALGWNKSRQSNLAAEKKSK